MRLIIKGQLSRNSGSARPYDEFEISLLEESFNGEPIPLKAPESYLKASSQGKEVLLEVRFGENYEQIPLKIHESKLYQGEDHLVKMEIVFSLVE
ncbi:MAG: hypothetical protein K5694_00940 [Bacilli bacterium]|nr:hypothetical protein [Bacilli bacterium]